MICYDFTKRQYKVLLAVIRKTYGWRKKDDDIPSSQLSEMTGLADTHCRAAVRELVDLRVIDAKPGRYGQVISIEKDYSRWISKKDQNSPGRTKTVRTETVRGEDQNGPATRTKTVREGGPKRSSQKKLSKTTIKSPQGYTERDRDPRARTRRDADCSLSGAPGGVVGDCRRNTAGSSRPAQSLREVQGPPQRQRVLAPGVGRQVETVASERARTAPGSPITLCRGHESPGQFPLRHTPPRSFSRLRGDSQWTIGTPLASSWS